MSRIAGLVVLAVLMALVAAFPAGAQQPVPEPPKTPTASGSGGSAATVDPLATKAAIDVLASGGNAVDATVAAAGVLGVVEPFSCGIGGGGFMVIYDAKRRKVDTIDSRETAPAGLKSGDFEPYSTMDKFEQARVSGLSVGVPGTVRGWETALRRYGTRRLASLLEPGERIARRGFRIDATFNQQVKDNEKIFDDFPATRDLYLTSAQTAKPVGEVQRNRDMARTYERIGRDPGRFYSGAIARDIAEAVQHPPEAPPGDSDRPHDVLRGTMTTQDLARYQALQRRPTKVNYRGLDIYGMGPPSSGGSTVGEALNILEGFPRGEAREAKLHHYLEASKLAYADRNAFVGDPDLVEVPLRGLLSDPFAADRRTLITEMALPPQVAGDPWKYEQGGHGLDRMPSGAEQGQSTTHLTVADRWGNVVSYTFTIEQTGGSGIVVPGRGFLLNNELTDFTLTKGTAIDPPANYPAPFKRPRSSMAPTLVFDHGRPAVALGSPGGATIITTVLQILVNHIDFRQSLPEALAAPRASQRNSATTPAEPAFQPDATVLTEKYGHAFSPIAEIGAATGIAFLDRGRQQAVAEPTRRGGGSAMVVRPD